MDRVVFSGIKPSGDFHLGNYIGAVRHWVKSQSDGLNIFCIVDMHAITVDQNPEELKKRTLDLAAILLASGIDPSKSILFVQSQNFDHANLGWIMNCNVGFGHLSRMTQFKDKKEKGEDVSAGFFTYPALMAADILLYNTTHVPVGDDQKQHVELTRDIAEKFNSRYGQTFVMPEAVISEHGARIMSLTDPTQKMSKSDDDINGCIYLLDEPETIRKKIMSATTDSGSEVKSGEGKAGINNLLEIYSQLADKSIEEIEKEFEGKGYGDFKKAVAEAVITGLEPIRSKYKETREGGELLTILEDGVRRAKEISSKKLGEVYKKVGFIR